MKKKHRNRLISRLLAMCLAVVMMLSMGITASAALPDNLQGEFTVSGFDTDPAPTVTAYQIITVNIDETTNEPKYPAYTWAPSVATWLTNKGYEEYIDKKLGTNAVADVFKNGGVPAADVTKFLEELAAAIKDDTITGLASKNENVNAEGKALFKNMALGEYLIIASGGVKIYQPTTVKLVPEYKDDAWNVGTAVVGDGKGGSTVKGSAPQIKKSLIEINDDAASADHTTAIGDTVTFKLAADVPEYPEDTTKKTFIISDKVGTGLEYQASTVRVWRDQECTIEISPDMYEVKTDATVTFPDGSNIERTFVIEFNPSFFESTSVPAKVYVTYEAKVTAEAFATGVNGKLNNEAYLGYSNDPYDNDSYTEGKDSETVYTYAINLTKVDTDGKGITTDIAKFELKNSNNETLYFTESNGVYTYDSSNTPTTSGVTKDLTTSSTGTLKIQGLDTGTYTLIETNAPDGYVLPNGTITIEIYDENNSGGPDGEIDEDKGGGNLETSGGAEIYVAQGDQNAGVTISYTTISFKVVNKTAKEGLFNLPVTGGAGTVIFTMAGILLMGGAVALLVVVLRRKRS